MTGSLQIAELVEHPGAILVQWFDEVMFLHFHSFHWILNQNGGDLIPG